VIILYIGVLFFSHEGEKMIKWCDQKRKPDEHNLVPFGITFNGSIADSIARIFKALCRLVEGVVDWLIWKLHNNMRK